MHRHWAQYSQTSYLFNSRKKDPGSRRRSWNNGGFDAAWPGRDEIKRSLSLPGDLRFKELSQDPKPLDPFYLSIRISLVTIRWNSA